MIDALAEDFGVPVHETPTGFTAMAPAFRAYDAIIAGEETGGFAFRNHLPDRDGILTSLFLLDMLVQRGGDLGDALAALEARVGKWRYDRLDLPCRQEQGEEICGASGRPRRSASPVRRSRGWSRPTG